MLLERGRVGQRWHERWGSLTLLSPNWMNRLPGEPEPAHRDGFLPLEAFVAHLDSYARSFGAPVVEGVEVERIERFGGGFRVSTTSGAWLARSVVLATGDAAEPRVPLAPPQEPLSLHSAEYRRPELVPPGPVLVVGAGASGQQIALELQQAGRNVVLAAGRHSRAPRRYRGRDIFEWAHLLGDWDRTIDEMPDVEAAKRVPLFPLSGANGGRPRPRPPCGGRHHRHRGADGVRRRARRLRGRSRRERRGSRRAPPKAAAADRCEPAC